MKAEKERPGAGVIDPLVQYPFRGVIGAGQGVVGGADPGVIDGKGRFAEELQIAAAQAAEGVQVMVLPGNGTVSDGEVPTAYRPVDAAVGQVLAVGDGDRLGDVGGEFQLKEAHFLPTQIIEIAAGLCGDGNGSGRGFQDQLFVGAGDQLIGFFHEDRSGKSPRLFPGAIRLLWRRHSGRRSLAGR